MGEPRRFLVPSGLVPEGEVTLDGELYRHIARVLRLKEGDSLLLCNGAGQEFHAVIRSIGKRSLVAETRECRAAAPPPRTSPTITLIQGLPKGDKFDLIIQKATELGVGSIIAFPAAHSVVRISPDQQAHRIARWQKIALEAARQSERATTPSLSLASDLDSALRDATQSVKLFLSERERDNHLRGILPGREAPESVALLVGPEGGFSAMEGKTALEHGFIAISLGPRILRTETASLAMLSILQYQWGDMG